MNLMMHRTYNYQCMSGTPAGGGGASPPPKPKKIVVEKWCYIPERYKMTKVREDGIENGKKSIFH